MVMIDLDNLTNHNPLTIATGIAARVKQRRLENNLTQAGLAERAGIPLPTYRLFEKSGKISLTGLLQIAYALNCTDDFGTLFARHQWQSLDEMLENKSINRKRGTRK